MLEAKHVLGVRNELGEGPVWHAGERALYWTDIEKAAFTAFTQLPPHTRRLTSAEGGRARLS
jgi:sugar lactone lactonase YvrE